MDNVILTILMIFLSMIGIALVVFMIIYFYNKHGKTEELAYNKDFVLNFTDQTENFLFNELESHIMESGKRNNKVLCKSFEVEFDKDNNPILPPKAFELQTIITHPSRRICLGRGSIDQDRGIILYLPENLSNIDDNFRNTRLYKMLEPLILKNDALENTIKSYVMANQKNKELIDLLLTSNLDEKVIQKLKIIKNTISEAENVSPGVIPERG